MEGRAARRRVRAVVVGRATAYLGAAAVIAVSAGMRADILRSYPQVDPAKVDVVHNGIDLSGWAPPGGRRTPVRAPRHRPRRGRRSSSSGGSPGRRACRTCLRAAERLPAGRPARAVRGGAGHPGDHGRGERAGRRSCASSGREWCGSSGCSRATSSARSCRRRPRSSARRSTSRSASSTSRRWPARRRSSARPRAASPRSSTTASPGGSCPIDQVDDGTGTPATRSGSSPIWRQCSPR